MKQHRGSLWGFAKALLYLLAKVEQALKILHQLLVIDIDVLHEVCEALHGGGLVFECRHFVLLGVRDAVLPQFL